MFPLFVCSIFFVSQGTQSPFESASTSIKIQVPLSFISIQFALKFAGSYIPYLPTPIEQNSLIIFTILLTFGS